MRPDRFPGALAACFVALAATFALAHAALAHADDVGLFGSHDVQKNLLNEQIHEGWELDAYGGAAFRNYTLSSDSGFSAKLPSTLGITGGLEGLYRPLGSEVQWLASFQHQATRFSNIPSVSPTALTALDDSATVGALFQLWQNHGTLDSFQIGAGLSLNSVNATQTLPGAVETSFIQVGPSFLARYTSSLSDRVNYRLGFNLMTPFYMREFYQNTGSRYLALNYGLSAEVTTPITDNIDLGIRFYGSLETADYQGTGQRDSANPTVNGAESLWVYGIPVEIRIKF